jgi:hypothetical protein
MTIVHDTAVKVDVYPDEFRLILKALNRALKDADAFTKDDRDKLYWFVDYFSDLSLDCGS